MEHQTPADTARNGPLGEDRAARLSDAELEDAVRSADPAAFLILPRILRRVIKEDLRLTGFGLKVPHRKCYVIDGGPLLEIVDRSELGLPEDAEPPKTAILLARPDAEKLESTPAGDILIRCWRLLFHARVHAALNDRIASGALSEADIRNRIRRIGSAEFEEIRLVLSQEDLLLPPRDIRAYYTEFAALYLELRHFAPGSVCRYFPGIRDVASIDAIVRQDIDDRVLFEATRLRGAPNPKSQAEPVDLFDPGVEIDLEASPPELPPISPSKTKYRFLMRKSQRPASLGNVVRAAIYRARAERHAPPELAARVSASLKMDVYRLIRRLQAALDLDDIHGQPWHESLFALVRQTPYGIWTAEAKLLYDLQKVCVDHEREIYTVDLVEWVLSWGRRPIKRPLPDQRDVLMLKHLRSAARRLAVVRLSNQQRSQLARLLHEAIHRVESRLRQELRPQIVESLEAVGLMPQNMPERVARNKLVEELLDHIAERGYLTMGDLRDAISRNNLKLPDLTRPLDLLQGDPLLRADRALALSLDGVYRRGEFYLRWMQRISSLAFGTATGRLFTRFAAVPFGGAYVALAGLHHLWEMIAGKPHPSAYANGAGALETHSPVAAEGFHLTSLPIVFLLGLLLMCLVNSAAFRRALARSIKKTYRLAQFAVIEPVRWLFRSAWLQRMLHSRLFILGFRFLVKPSIWTAVAWHLLPLDEESRGASAATAILIFMAVSLAINSRLGRTAEEVAADWIVQSWHRFGLRVITGLFWSIVDLFKTVLDTIERLMYSVDEWLRFKSGERNLTLALKAILGVVWFVVAYVLRFAINVLIEPQINPIKHFPVVTVSHKLLLPLIPHFARVLEYTLDKPLAWTTATAVITGIPGVFGFLVWELTENWRLYAANRRRDLRSVLIGEHGETLGRYLKTGFHSGTLPKRFAKLRRAERRGWHTDNWQSVRKNLQALQRIENSIRRFLDREFLELLDQSRGWDAPPTTIEHIRLGVNSVHLAFGCPGIDEANLHVLIAAESGWLVAGVTDLGWAEALSPQQRDILSTALVGLYKSAGVELVRQQIDARFGPPPMWCDITAEELIVWPEENDDVELRYDLQEEGWIAPQSVRGLAKRRLPTVERSQLVFADVPVLWDRWVAAWNRDAAGKNLEPVAPVCVLPS